MRRKELAELLQVANGSMTCMLSREMSGVLQIDLVNMSRSNCYDQTSDRLLVQTLDKRFIAFGIYENLRVDEPDR
jgi:hypothetical protein